MAIAGEELLHCFAALLGLIIHYAVNSQAIINSLNAHCIAVAAGAWQP